MEPGRISELLDKYWRAETDEAEEAELRKYFAENKDFNDHAAQPLFEYFGEEQKQTLSPGFDAKLESITTAERPPVKWLYPFMKVAAVVLIAFSVVYIFLPRPKTTPVASIETDTYENPEQAYREARKALLLISNHLNTGKSYIDEVGKLNKAEQLIHSKTEK